MPDSQVGSYRLAEPLGRGTSGVVYRAEHVVLGRPAALKLLAPDDEQTGTLGRFLDEARALARLQHPGLVQIFDCGFLPDGGAYLAMELLDGELLADRLARGRLPLEELVEVARQLAEALEVVHDAGLVHRDIKPANVFLLEERGRLRVKLLDFGVAKQLAAPKSRMRTAPGTLVGTPYYMSPEQCRGETNVDRRADVYALGAVLFELACGRPPFNSDALPDVIFAHMYQAPPSLRTLAPELPELVGEVVARALAKSPEDRFPCALAVATALAPAVARTDEATARRALPTDPMMSALPPKAATIENANAKVTVKVGTIDTVLMPAIAASLPRPTRPMPRPPRARRRWPVMVALLLGLTLPAIVWRLAAHRAPPSAQPKVPSVAIQPAAVAPIAPVAPPVEEPPAPPRPVHHHIAPPESPPDMALARAHRDLIDPFPNPE